MTIKAISSAVVFSAFMISQTYGFEAGSAGSPAPPKVQISEAIADRFVVALRNRDYSFLTEDKLKSLRKEISDFTAKYQSVQLSLADHDVLLAAIDQYVPKNFLNHGLDYPGYLTANEDVEGAYLKFRDSINTFKWKLWLALTRKPATAEQIARCQAQHDWLRQFITGVPIRPGDGHPIGIAPGDVRTWASAYLERTFTDPLSLLYDPMTDPQFEVFKKLMVRRSVNGFYNTVSDVPVCALSARAHDHADVDKAYAYPFDIDLPFEDEVRSIWGGGDGAGPHLVFTSNAQFRGQDVFLESRSVFDIVSGLWRVEPAVRGASSNTLIIQWVREQNKGDIAYDDSGASLMALRGAKMAELNVSNWFEADHVSNADLHKLIGEKSRTLISVKRLPPTNGPRRVGVNEPRFFLVVQNREGRLAIIDLRSREFFCLNLVSRLRSAD